MVSDIKYPIAFNPLKAVHPKYHHLVASGLVSTFKKIWADSWGPRLEYILCFALLTLLEFEYALFTFLDETVVESIPTETIMKGYRINVTYDAVSTI